MADVRVLIVDDQEPFRRAMAAVVDATDGFEVSGFATTAEESMTSIAQLRPDLVLMDIHLPGIDGIEAARRITSAPDGPEVVLLSTYDEDQFDLDSCGCMAYIAKADFGPDKLSDTWSLAGA